MFFQPEAHSSSNGVSFSSVVNNGKIGDKRGFSLCISISNYLTKVKSSKSWTPEAVFDVMQIDDGKFRETTSECMVPKLSRMGIFLAVFEVNFDSTINASTSYGNTTRSAVAVAQFCDGHFELIVSATRITEDTSKCFDAKSIKNYRTVLSNVYSTPIKETPLNHKLGWAPKKASESEYDINDVHRSLHAMQYTTPSNKREIKVPCAPVKASAHHIEKEQDDDVSEELDNLYQSTLRKTSRHQDGVTTKKSSHSTRAECEEPLEHFSKKFNMEKMQARQEFQDDDSHMTEDQFDEEEDAVDQFGEEEEDDENAKPRDSPDSREICRELDHVVRCISRISERIEEATFFISKKVVDLSSTNQHIGFSAEVQNGLDRKYHIWNVEQHISQLNNMMNEKTQLVQELTELEHVKEQLEYKLELFQQEADEEEGEGEEDDF
jgi:hypothetical protein